jgi:hypothetical protein
MPKDSQLAKEAAEAVCVALQRENAELRKKLLAMERAEPKERPRIIALYNFGEMDGEWICHGVSFGGIGDRSRFVADIERRWK